MQSYLPCKLGHTLKSLLPFLEYWLRRLSQKRYLMSKVHCLEMIDTFSAATLQACWLFLLDSLKFAVQEWVMGKITGIFFLSSEGCMA